MVWSIQQLTNRELVPFLVVNLLIDIFFTVMLFQFLSCVKRNMKGNPTDTKPKRSCCLRRTRNGSKELSKFSKWKSSVQDISTCEIIGPQGSDCGMGDAGVEAKIRHRTLAWYPELKMQKRSITRKNYMNFDRSQIRRHPAYSGAQAPLSAEDLVERKAKYKDKHITWETECPVFVVYGYDPCRGELDYDENTMDDLSYREAEEIEKNIDKVLASSTPKKEASKSSQ